MFYDYFLKIRMEKKVFGFVFLIISSVSMIAQETDMSKPQILVNLSQNDDESGRIEIIQPIQVENLLKMQIANNRLQKGIPGYRILIFSESGQTAKQKMEETRMKFMRNFPDIEAHWGYDPPNFNIFVGDFRTKNEALFHLKKIIKQIPRAFIVSDIIQIEK